MGSLLPGQLTADPIGPGNVDKMHDIPTYSIHLLTRTLEAL